MSLVDSFLCGNRIRTRCLSDPGNVVASLCCNLQKWFFFPKFRVRNRKILWFLCLSWKKVCDASVMFNILYSVHAVYIDKRTISALLSTFFLYKISFETKKIMPNCNLLSIILCGRERGTISLQMRRLDATRGASKNWFWECHGRNTRVTRKFKRKWKQKGHSYLKSENIRAR